MAGWLPGGMGFELRTPTESRGMRCRAIRYPMRYHLPLRRDATRRNAMRRDTPCDAGAPFEAPRIADISSTTPDLSNFISRTFQIGYRHVRVLHKRAYIHSISVGLSSSASVEKA